ncbi:MAG TPA: hypothetical protein VLU06_07595, partial [Thermoanaerobaculia bacterium]|nr:hypothetical protein [Thermoanaerobaculia bacterium]
MPGMKAAFFRSPSHLRRWFDEHHAAARELWVGYFKKRSGKPSVTWPESVDEALCVGWIDGIRMSLDEESYTIRFTPRRRRSIWSAVNIRRALVLAGEGRMKPAGLKALDALGVGVTAYGVLSRGLLGGRWSKERALAKGDIRNFLPRFHGENLERN